MSGIRVKKLCRWRSEDRSRTVWRLEPHQNEHHNGKEDNDCNVEPFGSTSFQCEVKLLEILITPTGVGLGTLARHLFQDRVIDVGSVQDFAQYLTVVINIVRS